jgi:hypothetical protein
MSNLDYTYNESELITEVRNAMAGVDQAKVPDETITQSADMIVVPLLNQITGNLDASKDQDAFDHAVVMWTAEFSYNAWLRFTRLRDREVEAYMDPQSYKEDLEKRTNFALRLLGTSRPPEIPNQVVTIKHDSDTKYVNVKRNWISDVHS